MCGESWKLGTKNSLEGQMNLGLQSWLMWKGSDTFQQQLLDYTTGTINYGLLYNCIFYFFSKTWLSWNVLSLQFTWKHFVTADAIFTWSHHLFTSQFSYFILFTLFYTYSFLILCWLTCQCLGVKRMNNKVWQTPWTLEITVLLHHMQDWEKNMPQYTLLNKHGSSNSDQ